LDERQSLEIQNLDFKDQFLNHGGFDYPQLAA